MTPESTDPPHFQPGPDDVRPAGSSSSTPVVQDPRRGRVRIAWGIAIAADFLQWVAMPLFAIGVSPWNDALDIVVGFILFKLLGWHWAFVPTFLIELFPIVDLAPTWTVAVFLATRRKPALPPKAQ